MVKQAEHRKAKPDANEEARQQKNEVGLLTRSLASSSEGKQIHSDEERREQPPALIGSMTSERSGMPIMEKPLPNAPFIDQISKMPANAMKIVVAVSAIFCLHDRRAMHFPDVDPSSKRSEARREETF